MSDSGKQFRHVCPRCDTVHDQGRDGGLAECVQRLAFQREQAKLRVSVLMNAIKEHHGQKADDRCWMDDDKLYAAAGLEQVDRRVGDKTAMLINCARFLEKRCEGGKWPTYAELEKKLTESHVKLSEAFRELLKITSNEKILHSDGKINWGPYCWDVAGKAKKWLEEGMMLDEKACIPHGVASECIKFLEDAGCGQAVGKGNTLWCMVQEIIAERDELNERIQLAGGYHERTPREVEIEEALEETPPHLRDPADNAIAELLLLVDAGRNRVHEEVEKQEAVEKELAQVKQLVKNEPRRGVSSDPFG